MCICESCGEEFELDFVVDDKVWEVIKPAHRPKGAGLLCGSCIISSINNKYELGTDFCAIELKLVPCNK